MTSVNPTVGIVKAAPTVLDSSIVTRHSPVPEHAPDQPSKILDGSAVAVSRTSDPCDSTLLQLPRFVKSMRVQTIPVLETTLPAPLPDTDTESTGGGSNRTEMLSSEPGRTTVQLVPTELVQPIHSRKVLPLAAFARRVTVFPDRKKPLQMPVPDEPESVQEIPYGSDSTMPLP